MGAHHTHRARRLHDRPAAFSLRQCGPNPTAPPCGRRAQRCAARPSVAAAPKIAAATKRWGRNRGNVKLATGEIQGWPTRFRSSATSCRCSSGTAPAVAEHGPDQVRGCEGERQADAGPRPRRQYAAAVSLVHIRPGRTAGRLDSSGLSGVRPSNPSFGPPVRSARSTRPLDPHGREPHARPVRPCALRSKAIRRKRLVCRPMRRLPHRRHGTVRVSQCVDDASRTSARLIACFDRSPRGTEKT